MNISENELFNFVFYPENLSIEKAEYLKTPLIFDEEIEFYRNLKRSLKEELSEEVKLKIAEKISVYNPAKFHMLYPFVDSPQKRKNDLTILAAASAKEKPLVATKTFIDEANHYLIRLLNFKESAKIYVFSTTNAVLKNYKIVIYPTGQTFEQSDNSLPIELNTPIEAEKIELQFS